MGTSWAGWPDSISSCLLVAISYTGNMLFQDEGARDGLLRVVRHDAKTKTFCQSLSLSSNLWFTFRFMLFPKPLRTNSTCKF